MSLPRRAVDRSRRALCVGAIAGAALTIPGCGGFGPRTVELPQARLQELVARHFPVDKRLLDVIDLTLDSPRVGLQPEANRISVEVALRANGGGPIQTRLSGSLLVSEGLRFEPSDNTVRLVDVQVERFVIDGLARELAAPDRPPRQAARPRPARGPGALHPAAEGRGRARGQGTSARRPARHRQRGRDHAPAGGALRPPFIPGTEGAANMPPFAMRRRFWN
jgi:hypothetical protein